MLMLMIKDDNIKIIKWFRSKSIRYFLTKIYYMLRGYKVEVID